ncbi:acetyl-CoA carboxylase biotin carboxyl carrier protein [Scopulibacillus cellulosilyticus]|uniref:Biotin carboxyl carrier protein of acetyl-CoA carboxylase n=1 Tax=Scopulibacillus cellulosilyticus TaxID=2665665 RepID=A0ABW2Q148_9BACL
MINVRELEEVIHLMDKSSIRKIHVEHEGTKVIIDKTEGSSAPITSEHKEHNQTQVTTAEEYSEAKEEKEESHTQQILSPMVGTFYSRQEEGAEPFVQIGSQVKNDDPVCVIEAMKLFNEVEAGVTGEVIDILVEDGQVVEYGQPLFVVK